jgi:formylglycine-generating enzyme required for sulfatase activity
MRESLPWFLFVVLFALAAGGCGPGATPAPSPTPAVEPTLEGLDRTWTRPADGMVMVYVPAGEFEMGGTQGWRDELPVHTVVLDGFWMDRTEVPG